MNPQKENGYTPIANELFEALMRQPLSGYEFRVLNAIFRKTYGYSKKQDRIALSQIAKMTGISKSHVSETVTKLGNYYIVTKIGNDLAINKDFSLWNVPKLGNSKKSLNFKARVPEIGNEKKFPKSGKVVPEIGIKKFPKSEPHKQKTNNTKDIEVREFISTMLTHWNDTYKTSYKSVDPLINNFRHWYKSYSLVEICQAISNIQHDKFWKDKMTPTMLFRKKNPRGEDVDYIGTFLNIKPPAAADDEFKTPEQLKEEGRLW